MTGGEREVVKLSLGSGQPILNVLPIGLEGDTLTLVCPFPVLPVEVPVSVTMPGDADTEPVSAMIRRVGVELMGEAALPRFKLQLDLSDAPHREEAFNVGADDKQFEFEFGFEEDVEELDVEVVSAEDSVEPAEAVDDDDESEVEIVEAVAPAASASGEPPAIVDGEDTLRDRLPKISSSEESWSAGSLLGRDPEGSSDVGKAKDQRNPMLTWGGLDDELDDDPPWAAEEHSDQSMERVHASLDEPSRRRSRWPLRMAIALTLIVSVLAVGYEMRVQIAPLVSPIVGEELTLAALGLTPAPAHAAAAQAEPAADEQEQTPPAPVPITAEESASQTEGGEAAEEGEAAEAEPVADPSVEATDDQLRVILPTRWPVTEARSYRLNEPTGIVVDVPGGMASERARWIDTANERVRSVRVVEREDGVRFIIYLNDNTVPRYRVGYSRAGVTVDIMGPDPRHVPTK